MSAKKINNIPEKNSGIRADENGLYLGKFQTTAEYHKFKKWFMKEFLKRDVDLKTFLNNTNKSQKTTLSYDTARHWLHNNGIKIKRGINRKTVFRNVRLDKEVADQFADYAKILTYKKLIENGLRLLFGFQGNDMVVIYYPEGSVIFQWQKNRTLAICTADFKDSQLKTMQGIAELAYKNGQDWLINFAQSAGLPVFPPYTTEQLK